MSFESHKLNEVGFEELKTLKTKIVELKKTYEEICEPSRELSLALTKLEESSFWATKAMAQKTKNHTEKTTY